MTVAAWRERAEALEVEVRALYAALRDPRTPLSARVVIAVVVGLAVSPIDPIPDVIPVLGYLDDVLLLPAGIALARWRIPDEVLAECRERAAEDIDVGRSRWVVAALVVAAWLALLVAGAWLLARWL